MAALEDKRVAVIGVGGLGSPTVISLLQSGIKRIKVVDRDIVSRTDLHRQILYSVRDVGRPKVEVAVERLREMDPEAEVVGVAEPLTRENVEDVVKDVDIVIDGLDNMRTRYLLNRACAKWNKTYIFASAVEMFGNVSTIIPGRTPCLECFYGGLDDAQLPKCGVVGVHPSVLGVVSNIAVSEAMEFLERGTSRLAGKLLFVDLRELSFDVIGLTQNPSCPVCVSKKYDLEGFEEEIEESCARDGSGTFFINKKVKVSLPEVRHRSERFGWKVLNETGSSITIRVDDRIEGTILASGSMVFKVKSPIISIEALKRRLLEIHQTLVGDGAKGPEGDLTKGSS